MENCIKLENICLFDTFCPFSWQEELQIVVVQSGKCKICVDGDFFELLEGEMAVIFPFSIFSVAKIGQTIAQLCVVQLNLRKCQNHHLKRFLPMLNTPQHAAVLTKNGGGISPKMHELVGELMQKFMANFLENDDFLPKILLDILTLLQTHHTENGKLSDIKLKQIFVLKKLFLHISSHLSQQISIAELSKNSSFSQYYLMKLFKNFAQMTIVDYANKLRVFSAAKQLLTTTDDINQIAQRVGFSNISYFNRQFRQHFGMTPKQYANAFVDTSTQR